jgi:hypothetical protein
VTIRFGYYADLRTIQLDEQGRGWIQAMRVGSYLHPLHGKLDFSLERVMRFADSVRNKVRGIDLDVDYDHKMDPTKGHEAAGWIKDAKVEGDALYLLVDWTQTALGKIKEGAYRYFSPEFKSKWTDAAGVEHQDVLFGGGITNRPFLKDLLPLNLSELSFAETPNKEEGVDGKELRTKLGLPEDATDEQVLEHAGSLHQQSVTKGAPVDHTATTHAPNAPAKPPVYVDGQPQDASTAAQRVDKDGKQITDGDNPFLDKKKLSELAAANPMFAWLLQQQEAQAQLLNELTIANKRNEVKVKLTEYQTGNKILSPALLSEAEKLLTAVPVQLHETVHALLAKVRDGHGTVQLGETGNVGGQSSRRADGKTNEQVIEERIVKLRESDKNLSYGDAAVAVMAEDPTLFSEYQDESYLFKA